ncbi:MAG: hypothetical protein IJU28_09805 [Clostridia bacterium]|nr:hypothetical protein [Clostridia bacterium]
MQHLIIVKYSEAVTDREAFLREVGELFKGLTEIKGIRGVRLLPGKPLRENRYDLIIKISMEESALEAYDKSEIHQRWKSDYAKYVLKKAIFDCEDAEWIM